MSAIKLAGPVVVGGLVGGRVVAGLVAVGTVGVVLLRAGGADVAVCSVVDAPALLDGALVGAALSSVDCPSDPQPETTVINANKSDAVEWGAFLQHMRVEVPGRVPAKPEVVTLAGPWLAVIDDVAVPG
jgi:hypothetical protein